MYLKQFPKLFWAANISHSLDRWAWNGLFMVLPIYLTGSSSGELGFSQTQKGHILGFSGVLLYLLPIFIGAIADRIGYRVLVLTSTFILAFCYLLVSHFTSYFGVFSIVIFIALASSITKPIVPATIAKTTNKTNVSFGLSIFYMLLNLGFLLGTIFASKIRVYGYIYVFYISSAIMFISLIQSWFLFKEQIITDPTNNRILKTISEASNDIFNMLKKPEIILLILFTALFSASYNQLFYSLPVYIKQWSNTSIDSIIIVASNFFYIIILQIPLSAVIKKYNTYNSMVLGYLICSFGIALTFMTCNPFVPFISIFIFSIGQMIAIPKLLEFIKEISPKGKSTMYMGGLFLLPLAIGSWLGGLLAGSVYQILADKMTLQSQFLSTKNFQQISEFHNLNNLHKTELLWNTFHPNKIWFIYTGVSLLSMIGLFVFKVYILKKVALKS